jgi:GH24 family phage-related lysozyme (muramidase)
MFTMMEELKYRIKEHEGFRDTVYQDHLGNATVGWGHLVTSDHQLLKQEQRSSKTGKKANA